MTVKELRKIAKEMGIKGYSRMNKEELISVTTNNTTNTKESECMVNNNVINILENKGYEVEFKTIEKNGVVKHGYNIGRGEDVARPIIYVDSLTYEDEELALYIENMYIKYKDEINVNLEDLKDIEFVKANAIVCLQKASSDEKLLKENYLDLEKYIRVYVDNNSSFKINKGMYSDEDIKEIWKSAENNTLNSIDVIGISKIISKQLGISEEELFEMTHQDKELQYVLTNKNKSYGASALLFPQLFERFEMETVYIIPSSIHEILAITDDNISDVNYLNSMIREVNSENVIPEERLSNHVYVYNRLTKEITY